MYVDIVKMIWEFLQPILSDSVKNQLKPKSGVEQAKDKAFAVYRSLREVNTQSANFIAALQEFADARVKEQRVGKLQSATESLVNAIEEFKKSLSHVEIPLEVHKPSVLEGFYGYTVPRAAVLDKARYIAEATVDDAKLTKSEELQALIASAKKNHELLSKAIEDFRSFLASAFSFKESV